MSKMNYVGSISILDRGDAPAQAVIDRNARSMAQRVADDTKDELEKVMTRVETIYTSFEDNEQVYGTSNLEYIQDIAELEEIMKDQVKKKKYQQQVTIFIVGFSDVSGQKLRLMQQVNEFFTENSKNIEEEDWFPSTPDLDLEEVGDKVEDSLQVARVLTHRLGDLNKEMVEYMATYAEKKASNKGKKKMEKALLQAKDEMQALTEKLQAVQTDLMEREEKLQATFKQLEAKNLEVQKFRTAAELAKKALQETEDLQEAITERDLKILEQRQQLTRMEIDLAQSNHLKERSQTKLTSISEETQHKLTGLQKELDEQKRLADDVKRDLSQFHDEQLTALREVHQQDMEEMKKQHAEQIKSLSTDLQRAKTELAATQHSLLELHIEKGVSDTQSEVGRQFDLDSEDGASRQSSKQKAPMVIAVRQKRGGKRKESRPSTKGRASGLKKGGSKSGGKEGKGGKSTGSSVASEDLDLDHVLDDLESNPGEDGEAGTQDEGGDPNSAVVDEKRQTPATRHSRRSRSTLAPVEEFEDYDDVYDLTDEQSWATVPKDQLEGRFAQYRRICQHKLREVDEQRQLTVAKTQRKVQLLKSQFVEHKTKWEAERKVLISQVEQAQQLQVDAEKEADQAMTQLEDFITEQERLEEEEGTRRSAILRGASGSSLSPKARHTPVPSAPRTPLPPASPGTGLSSGAVSAQPTPPESRNTQSSEELQNLMQQTDDAKSQRQGSKNTSPSPSNTPGAMGALLDVSRVPVHKCLPSPTPSPEASPAPAEGSPLASQTPSKDQPSPPTIIEAPADASEKAVAEAVEAAEVVKIAEEGVVEATEVAEVVEVAETVELVEAVEEARAVSVEEGGVMEGGKSPAGSRSASATGGNESVSVVDEETVPALDRRGAESSSRQERGEWVSDLPANLPVLMLMGGRVTSASVLGDKPAHSAIEGSRSVPGSRQSQRVLIMQPKSTPGTAMRLAAGAPGTAEAGSSLSSAGSFVPMALDVDALMNPKVLSHTPDFLTPTPTTAPASAALRREITHDSASMQREVTLSASLTKETPMSAGMQREVSEAERAVTQESTQAMTPASEAVKKEDSKLTSDVENAQMTTEEKSATPEKKEVTDDKTGTKSAAKPESADAKPKSAEAKPELADAKPGSAETKPVSAGATSESKAEAESEAKREKSAVKEGSAEGTVASEALTPAEAEELRGRLTGTKSAPPGVDVSMVAKDAADGQTTPEATPGAQRARTAAGVFAGITAIPIMKGSQLLQLAAMDSINAGMTVPVIYGEGGQVALFDITPGVVTPYTGVGEGETGLGVVTSTFLTPDGNLVVTDPMSAQEGAAQGLMAVEVRTTPQVASAPLVSRENSAVRATPNAGILRSASGRPSPASSPTRQVSFALRETRASSSSPHEGLPSPRLSRLQRSHTGEGMPSDLSVVMETSLPTAQEQALESMRKMLMEESLAPKQQNMLDSMRTALSTVKSHRLSEKGRADSAILADRGWGDGSSRLTSDEMLRTMTVFTLASQLSQEAFKLGVRPNSIFHNFSRFDTQLLSEIVPQVTQKGQPEGISRETTTADLPRSATEAETVDGASEEANKQVMLEELQDLPPIEGTSADEASTPSLHPPATAATIGSLPGHDQLETPLAEIADASPTELAKGDKDVGAEGSELKEDTPDAMITVSESVEDDLREESARSRASLRSDYKKRLVESRQAAEDRRAKSPQIKLPANLSVDDELVLDDDDEEDFDDDMALPDDFKEELEEVRRREMWEDQTAGTPPPSKHPSSLSLRLAAGKWSKLLDHPILQEYLKTYHCVTAFKETLSKLLLDKDMMSASQIVADLETLVFETDKKVMPQVEQFTNNVIFILDEISSVINSAVMVDREPPVSSLLPFSRDENRSRLLPTRQASSDMFSAFPQVREASPTPVAPTLLQPDQLKEDTAQPAQLEAEPAVAMETKDREFAGPESSGEEGGPPSVQGSRKSSVSDSSTKQHLAELQNQCSILQVQLEEESKKHEEQLRHNTVVMMEMQDTINDLQRELSAIGKASKKPRSPASASHLSAKTPSPDQSLMFTRLDLERNAKIMKKAVLDQRLDADKYKEAVTTMDDYVSLPAQRLAHLVKKYVHHSRMKEIEENVKNSESLDEGVFDTLDKMEALQNQRARQWAEKMDLMGIERLRLAAMLMDSLDSIEQESGLFLIKPMYSYRGRELKAPPTQKLARPVRTQPVPRHQSAARESTASFVPAPTPASNARRLDRQTPTHQMVMDPSMLPPPPPSRPEDGVVGSGAIRNVVMPQSAPLMQQPYQTWNMSVSQTRLPMESVQQSLNTPRMLELDINRMLIGQNNISTKLPHPPTDDRLVNASNNSLRSYVTVQRPAASLNADRPPSAQGGRDTGAPPSSPSPHPSVGVSPADRDVPKTLTSPPPLPPIGDRSGSALSSQPDDPEPPRSPPGSSMYQSTTHDQEEGNTYKEATRPSSQLSLTDIDQ